MIEPNIAKPRMNPAALAIERKVLPAGHDDIIGSLGWLAELRIKRWDLASCSSHWWAPRWSATSAGT